jgi:hypothetical protein
MTRYLFIALGGLLAIALALLILVLLAKLLGMIFGGLWRCFCGLWRTAFPPAPPPTRRVRQPRRTLSPNLQRLINAAELVAQREKQAQAALPPPTPTPPPPKPLRPLPQPSAPGENFLYVGDILVKVRETNGDFFFETDPPNRRDEAMDWLLDEGLLEKITNKTFRWGDPQPPSK